MGARSSRWAAIALVLLVAGLSLAVAHFAFKAPTAFANASNVLIALGVASLVADRLVIRHRQTAEWHQFEEDRQNAKRESRFRAIISTSADAYIEINEDGSIAEWNEKSAALFGWTASEVLGKQLVDTLLPPKERDAGRSVITSYWYDEQRAEGKRLTSTVQNRAGRTLYIETTMWVDEAGGRRMNMFIRDHTDRHEVEQAVQKALADEREAVLRLQELDRVKNDFVSSISHELRSPLTSTIGYLELLADGDAGELDTQQAHMVEIASRNARRLQVLIEDLLTLSRIESGSFRVQFRPVDLGTTIRKAVQQTTVAANERNIRLSLENSPDLGLAAGDANELTRALGNIIGNAVKFTAPGGAVEIRARRFEERVSVTITDNGIGIPAEEQKHLFSRFYRASAAVENVHQGAGLGLTIAKTIVEHHGGTIHVDSEPTVGTSVTIDMPALPLDSADVPTVIDAVSL